MLFPEQSPKHSRSSETAIRHPSFAERSPPAWAKGWSVTLAGAMDRGNYLGNSTGGSLTLRKTGSLLK